jgi:hypothetical protein
MEPTIHPDKIISSPESIRHFRDRISFQVNPDEIKKAVFAQIDNDDMIQSIIKRKQRKF